MKILLVVPRYNDVNETDYNYSFPLGLGYISAVLKKTGHEVKCLNLNHFSGDIVEIINNSLNSKKYDFVCTGNNAQGYHITERIIKTVKNHGSCPKFILGGQIITSEPELIFDALKPDFGIIGEGEETILELLDFIKKKKNLEKVKGIIYRDKGKVIKTEARNPPENLDKLPFPDWDCLGLKEQLKHIHTNDSYHTNMFDNPRACPLLASRSCPYQCTFCYHDSRYRKRSIDSIMKELALVVKKYKINIIIIYDECLAVDKKRLGEFCGRIKKFRGELPWDLRWTCQLRVDQVDEKTLKMMKDAGCEAISYGFESFSPVVLKSMRKNITPEQIDYAFKETMKAGIAVQGNFIFGDVAETKETAKTTLDYWGKNCKGQIKLGCINPYPNSPIYQHCIKKGIIKDKLDFIKNHMSEGLWLNMTDKMTDKDIKKLKIEIQENSRKYSKYSVPDKIESSGGEIYRVCVKCPFCRKINIYGNCCIKNKKTFDFNMICRNCNMRFYVTSHLQTLIYKFYPLLRFLRDNYVKIRSSVRKIVS